VTYGRSVAVIEVSFDDHTTEDGIFAAIDRVPFNPAADPELFRGLLALNNTVFPRSRRSRPDAKRVRILLYCFGDRQAHLNYCIVFLYMYFL